MTAGLGVLGLGGFGIYSGYRALKAMWTGEGQLVWPNQAGSATAERQSAGTHSPAARIPPSPECKLRCELASRRADLQAKHDRLRGVRSQASRFVSQDKRPQFDKVIRAAEAVLGKQERALTVLEWQAELVEWEALLRDTCRRSEDHATVTSERAVSALAASRGVGEQLLQRWELAPERELAGTAEVITRLADALRACQSLIDDLVSRQLSAAVRAVETACPSAALQAQIDDLLRQVDTLVAHAELEEELDEVLGRLQSDYDRLTARIEIDEWLEEGDASPPALPRRKRITGDEGESGTVDTRRP